MAQPASVAVPVRPDGKTGGRCAAGKKPPAQPDRDLDDGISPKTGGIAAQGGLDLGDRAAHAAQDLGRYLHAQRAKRRGPFGTRRLGQGDPGRLGQACPAIWLCLRATNSLAVSTATAASRQ